MYNGGTYERLEFLNNMVPAVLMGDREKAKQSGIRFTLLSRSVM